MAKILSNAVTWIIVLLSAIIVLLAGVVLEWWGGGEDSPGSGPSSDTTPGATPGASFSPEDLSGFVERPVTTGEYIPSAEALTPDVLSSAGSGWVVAINDTSQVNTAVDPHTITSDQKILYLIAPTDPDGTRYELANLDDIGLTEPNLVAWDDARDLLLLQQDRTTLNVFNMATGTIDYTWTFCPSGDGWIWHGEARDGSWLVRGTCGGTGVDGLYDDEGATVTSHYTIVGGGTTDLSVFDFGETQVAYKFEGMADEKFVAYYPDGTSARLPWDAGDYCGFPISKGRGDTLAVSCDTDTGGLSIGELPIDGSLPYEVVSATQLEDFAMAYGGFGPGEFGVLSYWSDSALGIIQFWLGDGSQRIGVLYGGSVEAVGMSSYPFRECHAVEGTAALVSGDGPLWWHDFDTGHSITLLPGSGSDSPIQVVGTAGYTALRLP